MSPLECVCVCVCLCVCVCVGVSVCVAVCVRAWDKVAVQIIVLELKKMLPEGRYFIAFGEQPWEEPFYTYGTHDILCNSPNPNPTVLKKYIYIKY